ncbi:MAG: hypothetical protein VYD87_06210 [Pseudomonadota bacterium]|nr:hypothetical protein [Pseudomonadota bacterium]
MPGAWLGLDRWAVHTPANGLIRALGLWLLLAPPCLAASAALLRLGLRPTWAVVGAAAGAGLVLAIAAALTWNGGVSGPRPGDAIGDALLWFAPVAGAQAAALLAGIRIAAGWRLRLERRPPPG